MPTHNRGGNLVANRKAKHGCMSGAGLNSFAHPALDILCQFLIVQESNVFFPWQPYHDAQVMLQCYIKKPPGRHGVGSDRIYAVCGHLREIALDCARIVVLTTLAVRPERTVGYPADVEFLIADVDELPLYDSPDALPDRDMPGRIEVELGDSRRLRFFEKRPQHGFLFRKSEKTSGLFNFL